MNTRDSLPPELRGYVSPDELLGLLDGSGDSASDDLPDHSLDSGDPVLDLFDPLTFGHDARDVSVGVVGTEEDPDVAPDDAEALRDAAQRCLSKSRATARKKSELVSFTEEDFETEPQRNAFVIIKQYKNLLFGSGAKPKDQWKAIDFFFTIADDGQALTFDLCCRTLAARIDVIRLRIQYEFFLRWVIITSDFPFLTVPVPDIIDGEIAYIAGPEGRRLATLAWNKPGITTDELLERAGNDEATRDALSRLEDKLILCQQDHGFWYLTGRNPYLMRKRLAESKGRFDAQLGGSVHWSRLL